jgi:two-component system, chemotaxis family, chemotaxis protein CheY
MMDVATAVICDDALFMRTLLADILRGAGIEVVGEAANGRDGVEQYRAHRPDLMLMDVVMPEMSGIDAVRAIVAEHPDARIVMCTAMGQQALVEEALRAGARDYIVKPFQPSRVLETVERLKGANR